ncbi:MAG: LamG-like jellyroll fold domain-containing protein [Salibacteraceae bacterium]
MKYLAITIITVVLSSLGFNSIAQDTTVVQTLTFNDITKRRDVFKFPDDSKSYRKILMRYNLKCDPKTTQDNYNCGEWDYLSYIYVYGHDGKLDSTRKTHSSFKVNNSSPATFGYKAVPLYDQYRETQYSISHTGTTSLIKDTLGIGTVNLSNILDLAKGNGRSQFVWTASELTAAGLTSGNITGIELDVSQLGSDIDNFEIKMGHTSLNGLSSGLFVSSGLSQVYKQRTIFSSTGLVDLQFPTSFNWNGTDNLIIEFSFDSKGVGTVLNGENKANNVGLSNSGTNSYLQFSGNQNTVTLGKAPAVTGAGARTIEIWARIDQFTNAGLFQAGSSGTGRDFTLRTTNTKDQFRAQLWGTGYDFNFTYPGAQGAWHHYAMSYDGTTCRVFIDGQLVASNNAALVTPSMDFRVGRWQGNYLQGGLDELRIWDKALSQTEIENWMNKTVDNTHPDYSNLIGYYDFNENAGITVSDKSPKSNVDGVLTGIPWWSNLESSELFLDPTVTQDRPNIVFERGVYTSVLDSSYVMDTVNHKPVNLTLYGNPANGVQIPDNEPNHPTKATQSKLVWEADKNVFVYDKATGNIISQTMVAHDTLLTAQTKVWYSPEYRIEIGRFITPYGIGLDLGPEGFAWWYDVTDYVHYLQDSVDLQAGDQLELIDLRFLFLEGTPTREVLSVNRVWGQSGSKSYKNLDNDVSLNEVEIPLDPKTKSVKIKTRFTGHGHNSNDGSYPHCCEWTDNTHSLIVDGVKFNDWHIWQENECAENPVFPQGGTWPGAREGWCPGDVVRDNDFEVGFLVSGSSFKLDYDITDVPTNNQGMGNGNYVVAVHAVQYKETKFEHDVSLEDVYAPTNEGIHARKASICDYPIVVIKNVGTEPLRSCEFRYKVGNGDVRSFKWTGNLYFMDSEEVELPVSDEGFYSGNGGVGFEIVVANPNGAGDQNPENNKLISEFDTPDRYEGKLFIKYTTNNSPSDNWYLVKNIQGDTILFQDGSSHSARTNYIDTLDLKNGCYTFYMHDVNHDGLSYFANTAQGSGALQLWNVDEDDKFIGIKSLKNNFGRSLNYSFTYGQKLGDYTVDNPSDLDWDGWVLWPTEVDEIDTEVTMSVYPNPTDGKVNVELLGMEGSYKLTMYNSLGAKLHDEKVEGKEFYKTTLNLENSEDGIYYLRIESKNGIQVKKIVVSK